MDEMRLCINVVDTKQWMKTMVVPRGQDLICVSLLFPLMCQIRDGTFSRPIQPSGVSSTPSCCLSWSHYEDSERSSTVPMGWALLRGWGWGVNQIWVIWRVQYLNLYWTYKIILLSVIDLTQSLLYKGCVCVCFLIFECTCNITTQQMTGGEKGNKQKVRILKERTKDGKRSKHLAN